MNSNASRPFPSEAQEVEKAQPSPPQKARKLRPRPDSPQPNSHHPWENLYDEGGGAPPPQPPEAYGPDAYGVDAEKLIKQILGYSERSQQLVAAFTRTLPENGGSLKLAEAALAAALPAPSPSFPLWKDREGGRGAFNPAEWIKSHHSDLIGTEGARAAIGRRDPDLIAYYVKWIQPNRHPEDDLGLDTRRRVSLTQMGADQALEHIRQQHRHSVERARRRAKPKIV